MKYVGSKSRFAKELAPIIQSYITDDTVGYYEPFVGGANMIDKIKCDNKFGSDIHPYLISFLDALSKGWMPPKEISEEMYKEIKNNKGNYNEELVGYVGFQLSYGGKWFGGYRRDSLGKRNYSDEAYRNTIKQQPNLKGIKFGCFDFRTIDCENCVVYCDPPYKGTTKYAVDKFPYDEFYDWCRKLSKKNVVLISEYNMPEDFECIWSKETKTLIDSNKSAKDENNIRIEKLFICK